MPWAEDHFLGPAKCENGRENKKARGAGSGAARALDSVTSGRLEIQISQRKLHGNSHPGFLVQGNDHLPFAPAALELHALGNDPREKAAAAAANGCRVRCFLNPGRSF